MKSQLGISNNKSAGVQRFCRGPITRDRLYLLLDGDQLGELGRDVCHRIPCRTQVASRAEQRADFTEGFIRRIVHNRNKLVSRELCIYPCE